MGDLGELGHDREPPTLTFWWFGEQFPVADTAGDLELIAFLERAAEIPFGDQVSTMIETKRFLRTQIHPDAWDRVMELAREHHQQFQDLLQLSKDIVEGVTKFPTGRPSDSSDGPQTTGPISPAASSSPVDRAVAQLHGRPDLKMMLWHAQNARRAEAAERAAANGSP